MANQATGITLLGSLHFKLICNHSLLLKLVAACLFVCFESGAAQTLTCAGDFVEIIME